MTLRERPAPPIADRMQRLANGAVMKPHLADRDLLCDLRNHRERQMLAISGLEVMAGEIVLVQELQTHRPASLQDRQQLLRHDLRQCSGDKLKINLNRP
jgi:hypothetical protein